jgi:mitochondrial chaperone BCS1
MESILTMYTEFSTLMKANPVVAGAVSLWGLTVVTFILKVAPVKVGQFIFDQITTTMTIENCGGFTNERNFDRFLAMFSENSLTRFSRSLSFISASYFNEPKLSAGLGFHIFLKNGRFFWFRMSALNSTATEKEKKTICVYTLGRSHAAFEQLVLDFKYNAFVAEPEIYVPDKHSWKSVCNLPQRSIDTVIINEKLKTSIIHNLDHMYENGEWYKKRGLPHKKTFVLHGVPGTGKTSIISALARKYNKNVCLINLSDTFNDELECLMRTVPPKSFVVFEDFDTAGAVGDRKQKKQNDDNEYMSLDLTTILNVLDGIVRLDGICVFMTTNFLDNIDDAVLRKGRVDHIYEIKPFQNEEVRSYINLMYPDEVVPDLTFGQINGCDIQSLYMEYKEDFNGFISALPVISVIEYSSTSEVVVENVCR